MVCSQRTKQDNYHSSFYLLYTLAIYYCVTHYCVIMNSVLTTGTVHAPEEAIKRFFFIFQVQKVITAQCLADRVLVCIAAVEVAPV